MEEPSRRSEAERPPRAMHEMLDGPNPADPLPVPWVWRRVPTSSRTYRAGRTGDEAGEGGSASFVPDEAERTRAPPKEPVVNRCIGRRPQEFDRQIATPLPWLGGVAAKQLTAYERSLAHARTRPRRGDTEAMLRFVSEARFFSPTSSAGELLTWLGEQGPDHGIMFRLMCGAALVMLGRVDEALDLLHAERAALREQGKPDRSRSGGGRMSFIARRAAHFRGSCRHQPEQRCRGLPDAVLHGGGENWMHGCIVDLSKDGRGVGDRHAGGWVWRRWFGRVVEGVELRGTRAGGSRSVPRGSPDSVSRGDPMRRWHHDHRLESVGRRGLVVALRGGIRVRVGQCETADRPRRRRERAHRVSGSQAHLPRPPTRMVTRRPSASCAAPRRPRLSRWDHHWTRIDPVVPVEPGRV